MQHPRALIPLFLTELWERFGFYIIAALLIIYMTKGLHFTDARGYATLGAFNALVYISPIIGGFLADRFLGFRYSILIGAILLFFGYVTLASNQHEIALLIGLAIIIVGNGFLKPNISSFLGKFYNENDPRRESGYTIFYIGINIGALLATLLAGFIQQAFGWGLTFAVAAIGLTISIITYLYGFRYFADKGLPKKHFGTKTIIISISITTAVIAFFLLNNALYGNLIIALLGGIFALFLVSFAFRYPKNVRNKMLALLILITFSILFYGVFLQAFFSINLFLLRSVNRMMFGITVPPIAFLSLEPIFLLLIGPFFALLWQKLSQRRINPSFAIKFALAFFVLALALLTTAIATHFPNAQGKIPAVWMLTYFFCLTFAELLISPIALAMVTVLAPKKLLGLMMGAWFMFTGFGGILAGYFAKQADIPKGLTDLATINAIYGKAFLHFALIAFITGIVLSIFIPQIKRLAETQ